MNQSRTDVAYTLLKEQKQGMAFSDLWYQICEDLKINEDDRNDLISQFYTDLSLDGRFIGLEENVWTLREFESFDKVHIDMNDIYSSDDEIIEIDEVVVAAEDLEEKLFKDDDEGLENKNEELL